MLEDKLSIAFIKQQTLNLMHEEGSVLQDAGPSQACQQILGPARPTCMPPASSPDPARHGLSSSGDAVYHDKSCCFLTSKFHSLSFTCFLTREATHALELQQHLRACASWTCISS